MVRIRMANSANNPRLILRPTVILLLMFFYVKTSEMDMYTSVRWRARMNMTNRFGIVDACIISFQMTGKMYCRNSR